MTPLGDPILSTRVVCPACQRSWRVTIHEGQDFTGCPNCGTKIGVTVRRRPR